MREVDEHSDLVVIWGGNPVSTQVNVMTHAMRAKAPQPGGGRSLSHRDGRAGRYPSRRPPGTDGALAVAMMYVLFKEGFATGTICAVTPTPRTSWPPIVAQRPPEWAAPITGLSVDQIVLRCGLYGRDQRSFIRCHHGFSRSRKWRRQHASLACVLPAVTGAVVGQGRWRAVWHGHTGGMSIRWREAPIEGPAMRVDPRSERPDQSRLGSDPDRRSRL